MGKMKHILISMLLAILATSLILFVLAIAIGFIAFMINIVCANASNTYQTISFIIVSVIGVGVATFLIESKD